jgi:16S rRNA (uracil1498-N3)-methyltransferase
LPSDRYYVPDDLSVGQHVQLRDPELHHLARVMRAQIGECVELINGRGHLATARIEQLDKKQALLLIEAAFTLSPPSFEIILAQAIPRPPRLDFILEKGTELGMTQLWLFPGQHSEKKELSENQIERAHAIMLAATKQSGRLFLPSLSLKPALKQWQKPPFPAFFGDVDPSATPLAQEWRKHPPQQGIIIVIGPESGFSYEECERLKQLHARPVKLHQNVLRTDTAALTALSCIDLLKI